MKKAVFIIKSVSDMDHVFREAYTIGKGKGIHAFDADGKHYNPDAKRRMGDGADGDQKIHAVMRIDGRKARAIVGPGATPHTVFGIVSTMQDHGVRSSLSGDGDYEHRWKAINKDGSVTSGAGADDLHRHLVERAINDAGPEAVTRDMDRQLGEYHRVARWANKRFGNKPRTQVVSPSGRVYLNPFEHASPNDNPHHRLAWKLLTSVGVPADSAHGYHASSQTLEDLGYRFYEDGKPVQMPR